LSDIQELSLYPHACKSVDDERPSGKALERNMKACTSIESMQVNRVKAVVILFEEQDLLIRRISSEHRDFGCGFS